jgi:hypothetical protein
VHDLGAAQCTRLGRAVIRLQSASLADDYAGGCK